MTFLSRGHKGKASKTSGARHLDATNEGVFSIINPTGILAV